MEPHEIIESCYRQIKIALTQRLITQGYQPVHEEDHDAVFNSRYIIWSDNREALKFTWDGKERWFILEITKDLPIHATTTWGQIMVIPSDAGQCTRSGHEGGNTGFPG